MTIKPRELLEQINEGHTSWAPEENTETDLKAFQARAVDLIEALKFLVAADYIGTYKTHTESTTSKRYIDRVYITGGLTLKGQDKALWPD